MGGPRKAEPSLPPSCRGRAGGVGDSPSRCSPGLLLSRKALPGGVHPRGQERPVHSAPPAVRPQQRWPVLSPAPHAELLVFPLIFLFNDVFCQTILMVTLPQGSQLHLPPCRLQLLLWWTLHGNARSPSAGESMDCAVVRRLCGVHCSDNVSSS